MRAKVEVLPWHVPYHVHGVIMACGFCRGFRDLMHLAQDDPELVDLFQMLSHAFARVTAQHNDALAMIAEVQRNGGKLSVD